MIGSIDILANISSIPVASIAMTGLRSGIAAHIDSLLCSLLRFGGFRSSRIRNVVARKVRKITLPASQNVSRMPINGGNAPPSNGPARFPPIMPAESAPSAQPVLFFGVCVATRIIEPEEYPPATPTNKRSATSCQMSVTIPIDDMAIAMPRLARISISLRP